jgi:anthranilate synthase component I
MSAQEIISKQEGRSRGIYTGVIGYITSLSDFDFNVAIRTIWISNAKAYIQAGGAILNKSHLESEWEEALVKLKGMTKFSDRKANAGLL